MAMIEFINGLKECGFDPQVLDNNKLYFEYCVDIGKNRGKNVLIGFENLHDFPMNCPHGPHFKPIDDNWSAPTNGVHPSNFGPDWKHWSRPFNEWNRTRKTVKEYLSHIKNLMMII